MMGADLAISPAEVTTRRVRLRIAYNGAAFHGFAANVGVATVADTLTTAIQRVVRHPVTIVGAGRTDAGVHAWGQVVSADIDATTDLDILRRRINSQCAPDLVVRDVSWAPENFDARFSALWRRYRYTILHREIPDPFLARTAWHVSAPLSLSALRLATDSIVGEHDFSSWCRRPKGQPEASLRRRVLDAHWEVLEERSGSDRGLLRFEITGTAFCHQMVRSLVGTLVDIGRGKRPPSDMTAILRARDRQVAGTVAPPEGLCLWEVGYP
jgi:tRNA pseudouridine38-40 synthase